MFIELALVSILNSVNLAFLIEQTRAAKLYNRGGVELRETTTPRGGAAAVGTRDVPHVLRRRVLEGKFGLRDRVLARRVLGSATAAIRQYWGIWWPSVGPPAHDADGSHVAAHVGPHGPGQIHHIFYPESRRRLAPHARLLRRARDERVPPYAVGAPEGRPGRLAPRRRLDGVLGPLQRPLETLLANKTNVTIKI